MGTFYQKPPPEGIQAMSLDSPVFHGPAPYTAGGTQIGGVVHATSRPLDHSGPKELGKGGSVSRPITPQPFSSGPDAFTFQDYRVNIDSCPSGYYVQNGQVVDYTDWIRASLRDIYRYSSDISSLAPPELVYFDYGSVLLDILNAEYVQIKCDSSTDSGYGMYRRNEPSWIRLFTPFWDCGSHTRTCILLHEIIHLIDYEYRRVLHADFDTSSYELPSLNLHVKTTDYTATYIQWRIFGFSDTYATALAFYYARQQRLFEYYGGDDANAKSNPEYIASMFQTGAIFVAYCAAFVPELIPLAAWFESMLYVYIAPFLPEITRHIILTESNGLTSAGVSVTSAEDLLLSTLQSINNSDPLW